jgi:hypothetical protein
MSVKRRMLVISAGLVVAFLVIPAGAALADAGGPASCVGHEASGISPKGSSEEFPGGVPQLKAFLDEAFPGVPTGAIVNQIAKLHAGSHEGCDEILD